MLLLPSSPTLPVFVGKTSFAARKPVDSTFHPTMLRARAPGNCCPPPPSPSVRSAHFPRALARPRPLENFRLRRGGKREFFAPTAHASPRPPTPEARGRRPKRAGTTPESVLEGLSPREGGEGGPAVGSCDQDLQKQNPANKRPTALIQQNKKGARAPLTRAQSVRPLLTTNREKHPR